MEDKGSKTGRYTVIQRAGALLGVIALAGLSFATLWVALFGGKRSDTLFLRLLVTTISAPIAIWLLVWALGAIAKRNKKEGSETEEGESGNG